MRFRTDSVTRLLAEEALGCDVASAGELAIALAAGFPPAEILLHVNAKSDEDIAAALEAGVGLIVRAGPLGRRPLDRHALLGRHRQARARLPRRGRRPHGRRPGADALRAGARPAILDRAREPELCDLVGHHCESGDVLGRGVELAAPEVGDLLVMPVTGACCYSLSNNCNGARRPPVVICRDGDARLAVRRERFEDLLARYVA